MVNIQIKRHILLDKLFKHKFIISVVCVVLIISIVYIVGNFIGNMRYISTFRENTDHIFVDISYKDVKLSDYFIEVKLDKISKQKAYNMTWRIFHIRLTLNDNFQFDETIMSNWSYQIKRNLENLFLSNGIDKYISTVDIQLTILSGNNIYSVLSTLDGALRYSKQQEYKTSLTESDKAYAWTIAQKEVKAVLKSPSSAKFPVYSQATITKNGNSYTVTGYVDAQNSFGATIRSDFIITFDKISEDKYSVISVEVE